MRAHGSSLLISHLMRFLCVFMRRSMCQQNMSPQNLQHWRQTIADASPVASFQHDDSLSELSFAHYRTDIPDK